MNLAWPVFRFAELDSTNTEARRRSASGDLRDQWILADSQTSGRGRLDRTWVSPPGNIYATALFAEPGGIGVALRVPFAAALAVVDTILRFAPSSSPGLKWPNDVRVAGRKISGILVETTGSGPAFCVAAGIGLNVRHFPDVAGQAATSLAQITGRLAEPDEVFACLSDRFMIRLQQARQGFSALRTDWLAHAEGLGGPVLVRVGDEEISGVFEDLEPDGALRLRLPDGARRIIRAGEVNLIGRY